jgi:hypothetical protein
MVTASYISPDVASMHSAAVDRDIILLNEVGLDPGIDHMVAMSNIDRIRSKYASTFFLSLVCVFFFFFCVGMCHQPPQLSIDFLTALYDFWGSWVQPVRTHTLSLSLSLSPLEFSRISL